MKASKLKEVFQAVNLAMMVIGYVIVISCLIALFNVYILGERLAY